MSTWIFLRRPSNNELLKDDPVPVTHLVSSGVGQLDTLLNCPVSYVFYQFITHSEKEKCIHNFSWQTSRE
jgi:hypothetical protein